MIALAKTELFVIILKVSYSPSSITLISTWSELIRRLSFFKD